MSQATYDQAFDTNASTMSHSALHDQAFAAAKASTTQGCPLRGGEADDFLFAPDGDCAFGRRQKSFLDVFLGAGNKIAAATQAELALDIFAMALNRFYTEIK